MSPRVCFFISRMIVIVIATILTHFDVAEAQGDSCRCRFDPPFIGDSSISVVFPDTVEIDGCGLEVDSCSRELFALSPDQLAARLYVRGPWLLRLPDSALVISEAPYDTIIYRSWSDIDSSFGALRDSLASLESRFGSLALRKTFPEQGTGEWSREFAIRFDSFVPLQTVDSLVRMLPGVEHVHAAAFPVYLSWLPNDPGLRPGLDYYEIGEPEPIELRGLNDTIFWGADLHRTGWEWHLYRQKAMLAWELTRGKNADGEPTILGVPDVWGTEVEHPDFNDDVNDPDHNFTPATGTTRGDGTSIGVTLRAGHGLGVSSMAVAKAENGVGMAGVCPECVVVGFGMGNPLEFALGIDGDGVADQNRRHPQVLSCSWWEP